MNIKIARADILPILTLVTSVVEKRQTLPILADIFFSLTDGTLNIVGTDLEVEVSETIKNVAGDNGSFTISSRKIFDIARNLPEDSVISMKLEKNKILVSSGRTRYTLKTLDAEEFPRIAVTNWEERFKIKQFLFKDLLEKTAFSMGIQDVRYYLNGVLFELSQNTLRAVATDGHRLAQSDVDVSLTSQDSWEIIVPRKAVTEIMHFLDSDDDAEITIEVNKNHFKLTKDDKILITKLIDGKFPDFKRILEEEAKIMLSANRTAFIDTMVRVAILTTDKFMGVKVILESGLMRVTLNTPEQEEVVGELDIDYTGEKIESGYNVNYLIDAARAVKTEIIELHLQGAEGVCVIKDPKDDRSIWLVMPLKI